MENLSWADQTSRNKAKRKRTVSDGSQATHGLINPFSQSPNTLLQFAAAGLTDTDEDPKLAVPHFPHRRLPRESNTQRSQSPEDGREESRSSQRGKARPRSSSHGRQLHDRTTVDDLQRGHLGVLIRSIHLFLDQGDVSKAAAAYGLVLQQHPRSEAIDVRQQGLWAIGVEILMREGEEQQQEHNGQHASAIWETHHEKDAAQATVAQRWGSATNMNKVKAYLEALIHQHPYNPKFPQSISALHFQFAMLSCEIYNAHAEHVCGLLHSDQALQGWDNDELVSARDTTIFDQQGDEYNEGVHDRDTRIGDRREQLRTQTLTAMKDIAKRMDRLMQELPYSRNDDFLRLRGTASLYIADLFIPVTSLASAGSEDSTIQRELELQTARNTFQKLVDNGGKMDQVTLAILNRQNNEDGLFPVSKYLSLPIRKGWAI